MAIMTTIYGGAPPACGTEQEARRTVRRVICAFLSMLLAFHTPALAQAQEAGSGEAESQGESESEEPAPESETEEPATEAASPEAEDPAAETESSEDSEAEEPATEGNAAADESAAEGDGAAEEEESAEDDAPVNPGGVDAFDPFVVSDIRIEGLRRFDPGVVFSRIEVSIGDTLTEERSVEIIQKLFESGFFRSVDILRDGDILVISITENPTIAEVNFEGVSELSDDQLNGMLQEVGIVRARVFDRALTEAALKAMKDIYIERNFYKAEVDLVVSPLERNRVALLFEVDEGDQAYISSIEITGNEEFSDYAIKQEMNLEARGLFNFFGDSFLFSESGLQSDLERIRTRYLEDGYLRFEVESHEAEVSADKSSIDIVIHVKEGSQYVLAEHGETGEDGGDFTGEVPPEVTIDQLREQLSQESGEIFSSREAGETSGRLRDLLGNYGYAFAEVSYENELNDDDGTVHVVYAISPGELAYVRRINITGNDRTRDEVIRREMLQFERERYSRKKVESSRRRIRRLGFFNGVNITPERVEGSDDELDLNVRVTEGSVGSFRAGAGFSTDNELSFEVGLNTPNVFGSGNNFSADYSTSASNERVDFSLDEFYHTDEGVSRHIAVSASDRESSGSSSGYSIRGLSGEYGYGIPYSDDGKYRLFFVGEKIRVNSVSSVYAEFRDRYGTNPRLDTVLMRLGFEHDTRDSAQQPTDGWRSDLSVEAGLPVLDLQYYRANYVHDYYYQTRRWFGEPVWHVRGGVGLGGDYAGEVYPFYHRYFVGGTSNLRGFNSNAIGVDPGGSSSTKGGLSRLYGTAEASFNMEFFKTQKVYLAPFVDAGTVGKNTLGGFVPVRSSAGLEIRWISPIGPLRFSWARAIAKEPGDRIQDLQFSVRY